MQAAAVIAREEELGRIEAFVAELARGPAMLVLSGEAGIGKTILWEAGLEEAGRRAGRVLTCRGVEAEALLSFAGLSELLAPVRERRRPRCRRRAAVRSRSRCCSPSPEGSLRTRTRSGLRSSTCCARSPSGGPFSSASTTCSGSIRRPPACCRSLPGACAGSRSGVLRRSAQGRNMALPRPVRALVPAGEDPARCYRSARSARPLCGSC